MLICLAAARACAAAPPDAATLLQQARKALGQSAGLKSLVLSGTHKISTTEPGRTEPRISARELKLSILFPSRFLREETMESPMGGPGPVLVEGFDGETAWNDTRQTPGLNVFLRMGGPNMNEQAKAQRMHETFARYLLAMTLSTQADFPVTFTYAGQAEAPDGKADVVDAKGPGSFAVRIFLDSTTHLPLMLTYQAPEPRIIMNRRVGGGGDRPPDPEKLKAEIENMPQPRILQYQVRPSEFKKVGGVLLPHAITWTVDGKVAEEIEVKKYAVNTPLSPDLFRKN